MCRPLRALLRTSRTGPTRFDAWSSRRGRPESTLGEPPHVLGGCVVCWKGGAPPALHAPARAGALGAGGGCACSRVHPHRATRELRGLQGLDTVWGSVPKLLESLRFFGARTTSGVVRRTFALGVLRVPSGAHGGRMPTTSLLTRYSTACPCAQFSKANQKATSTTKSSFPHCILCQSLFSFSFSRVLEFCLFEKNQHHPIEYLRNGERFVKNAETRALTNKVILSYL
jgi:hypothetical protein